MACELVPWNYVKGAVLQPFYNKTTIDSLTCGDERKRLSMFYQPTGGHRKLRKMVTFNMSNLNRRIADYSDSVHLHAILGRPNVDLTMSCPGVLHLNDYRRMRPQPKARGDDAVTHAVAMSALKTAQTIYQQLNVASYQWQWGRSDIRTNTMMPREPYIWAQWDRAGRIAQAKVAVFVFPSWAFEMSDLSSFVYTDSFLDVQPYQNGRYSWDVSQMLWAMTYDYCVLHGIHHFVLTTYDKWIFGMFTENYKSGFVRHPMDYNSQSPTILQTLIFWMDAAMHDRSRR